MRRAYLKVGEGRWSQSIAGIGPAYPPHQCYMVQTHRARTQGRIDLVTPNRYLSSCDAPESGPALRWVVPPGVWFGKGQSTFPPPFPARPNSGVHVPPLHPLQPYTKVRAARPVVEALQAAREEPPKVLSERRRNSCMFSKSIEASRVVALHWVSRAVKSSTFRNGSTSLRLSLPWVLKFPMSQGQWAFHGSAAGFIGHLPLFSSPGSPARVALGKGFCAWQGVGTGQEHPSPGSFRGGSSSSGESMAGYSLAHVQGSLEGWPVS